MRFFLCGLLALSVGVAHANTDVTAAVENVRTACGGIGDELSYMKKLAGITTAVTGVGTVAGGVAVGTGIAKSVVDQKVHILLDALVEEQELQGETFEEIFEEEIVQALLEGKKDVVESKITELTEKSETLGDVRTGTLAASTATNIAGAVMSGVNRIKGDLKQQIDGCLTSVKMLSDVFMQAKISKAASEEELVRANNIVRACGAWDLVDTELINKRSAGATVSSGIGAAAGLAGTVTSASANSQAVREATGDEAETKEKNLNTAANVLAGASTAAGLSATIFNATQIAAIKRAATVADECEGALK